MRCYVFLNLCSHDYYNTFDESRLTDLTCSKASGVWMVEHQIVSLPATGASSEKIFSCAGNVVTEKQSRLLARS